MFLHLGKLAAEIYACLSVHQSGGGRIHGKNKELDRVLNVNIQEKKV
jgi:hypothetical protein